MLWHCTKCTSLKEDCCSSDYAKFITLQDAERIASFLQKEVKDFAMFSSLSEEDTKTDLFMKKDHPYYYDLSQEGNLLQLQKKKDGSCIFFKENRCSIHPARPLACRAYPFWYKKENDSFKIIIDYNGYYCPIITGSFEDIPVDRKKKLTRAMIRAAGETEESLLLLWTQLDIELQEYKQ